jgi:F420-non-reducing hydrogenase small subunit
MTKPTLSIGLMSGCFGCIMSFLELSADLIPIFEAVDFRRNPLNDEKDLPPVTVGLLEGAVSSDEDIHLAKLYRERATHLVALGTCPVYGGIGGLRNLGDADRMARQVYVDGISTVEGKVPSATDIPRLLPKVRPLADVVPVDLFIPGCPPPRDLIRTSLYGLLGKTEIPPRTKNLCIECPRTKEGILQPQRGFLAERVNAVMELERIDPERCLIEQGVLCLGPVTVTGCEARCPKANIPCRGCLGPTERLHDQGAKMIDALATLLPAGALMFMEDVIGAGYRFSLPYSETIKKERL